jgi:ATP-dependent protease ClpP protease subunit
MRSWYAIRSFAEGAEVAIYDEIGAFGVTAKAFLAELGAIPDEVPITLRINSPGGSVFDAVAIHNALTRHPAGVTAWIDGIAASAASYVAMAAGEVVMPENAFLMVHDPTGMALGTADDMRAMAEALEKIKTSLVAGYAAKSGRPDAEIAELMRKETWLDAAEAVELSFADRLAEPVRIAARFDAGRFRNAPPQLVEAVETAPDELAEEESGREETVDEAEPDVGTESVEESNASPEAAADPPDPPAHPSADRIRADAMAHARAVVDLCALAGLPQMAGRFLAENASVEDVRAALLAARAEAGPDIDPHHTQPGRASGAKPWGDVIDQTFRPRG